MTHFKLAILDDHQLFIDGISALLHKETNCSLVGKATNSYQLFKILESQPIDVLILDLNLHKEDGVELISPIKSNFPNIKIIVLTMFNSRKLTKIVVEKGADGYLLKSTDMKELRNAIAEVSKGHFYYGAGVNLVPDNQPGIAINESYVSKFLKRYNLTRRELDVISLLAQGYSNKDIAEFLFISEFTVKTHRKNLKKKLNLANTAQLVKFAYESGVL